MMYEILSPCGSMDAFLAAISAGADAVYLAGKMFGARSFANNFTDEELVYVINYAHLYGVKVYVTCNILIFEHEVEKFLNFIEFLHKNNVDAVIMQDIGMIDLVHKTFPNLEIHGSTQMHIHNLEGAFMAKALGLKRIVLARETPLTLVKEIKEKTGLEVEVFVHGALCVSYSGMCLFAASIGPRSGNRGTCSGCCRLPYQVLNSKKEALNTEKYPLSMKDLMTLQELDKLIAAGVDSFKIEGRMKSPSYVYTTTKLYKETRDNYLKTKKIVINKKDIYNLKNIFARPYTKGYLLNANNNGSHGISNVAFDATNSTININDNAYIGLNITKYNDTKTSTDIINSTINANNNGGSGIRFFVENGITNITNSKITTNNNGYGESLYGWSVKPGDSGYWAGVAAKGNLYAKNAVIFSNGVSGYSLYDTDSGEGIFHVLENSVIVANGEESTDIFDDYNSANNHSGNTIVTGGSLQVDSDNVSVSDSLNNLFHTEINPTMPSGTGEKADIQFAGPINSDYTALTQFILYQNTSFAGIKFFILNVMGTIRKL